MFQILCLIRSTEQCQSVAQQLHNVHGLVILCQVCSVTTQKMQGQWDMTGSCLQNEEGKGFSQGELDSQHSSLHWKNEETKQCDLGCNQDLAIRTTSKLFPFIFKDACGVLAHYWSQKGLPSITDKQLPELQIPMQQHPSHMPTATPAEEMIIQPPNTEPKCQKYTESQSWAESKCRQSEMKIIKQLELKP